MNKGNRTDKPEKSKAKKALSLKELLEYELIGAIEACRLGDTIALGVPILLSDECKRWFAEYFFCKFSAQLVFSEHGNAADAKEYRAHMQDNADLTGEEILLLRRKQYRKSAARAETQTERKTASKMRQPRTICFCDKEAIRTYITVNLDR